MMVHKDDERQCIFTKLYFKYLFPAEKAFLIDKIFHG